MNNIDLRYKYCITEKKLYLKTNDSIKIKSKYLFMKSPSIKL